MADELKRAGALIAAQRKRFTSECAVCGTPIEGTGRRRYCSNACKLRAARQRSRAQRQPGAAAPADAGAGETGA